MRYIPGESPLQDIVADDGGFLQLGQDGVLRSLSKNHTVVDFRQLDPDQFNALVAQGIKALSATRQPISETVQRLAGKGVDGRVVTDATTLFSAAQDISSVKPRFPEAEATSPVEKKDVSPLEARQKQDMSWCYLRSCRYSPDCSSVNCMGCLRLPTQARGHCVAP